MDLVSNNQKRLSPDIPLSPEARNFRKWISSRPRKDYETEIAHLKNWMKWRLKWLDSQFLIEPKSSHSSGQLKAGESVLLNAGGESIFYTLDGKDPRNVGGLVNSRALTEPKIVMDKPMIVCARTRRLKNGEAEWSAPARWVYSPHQLASRENIVVRETMVVLTQSGGEATGIVEIRNKHTQPVDLLGVELKGRRPFVFNDPHNSLLRPGEVGYLAEVEPSRLNKSGLDESIRFLGSYTDNEIEGSGGILTLMSAANKVMFETLPE